jgi:glycosyltransferase domain-containing protein
LRPSSDDQSELALPDSTLLTIVIPTHNRPNHCAALVRFLRRQGVAYRIVIADSSDATDAAALRKAMGTTCEIVTFPVDIDPLEKFIAAIEGVDTPFVALMPDDDITFPHAVDRCLEYLINHPQASAAQGYVLEFALREEVFDIFRVRWFTPSVAQEDALERLYHLIRRYQPFFWAVFRQDALLVALQQVRSSDVFYLKEMTFVAAAVLLGKFARLSCIYTLRGTEESLTPRELGHPFFALLADSDGFFAHYLSYREALVAFIERHTPKLSCPPQQLRHTLNLIHAIYLRPELDGGMMEYSVQRLLDPSLPPIPALPAGPVLPPVGWRDSTTRSKRSGRRYLWRREVLNAEPRDEITITAEERARVTRALDDYELDIR